MLSNIRHWAYINFDYLTGFGTGSITGIITLPNLYHSVYAIIMAFLTGIAGAAGAHLIRLTFDKLKKPKNG